MIYRVVLVLLLMCSVALPAQRRKLWWASAAALAAVSVLDTHSSWNKPELNPLLRGGNGRFGPRGLALKSSFVAGGIAFQWWVMRRHPGVETPAAAANFALAGVTSAAVIRNYR